MEYASCATSSTTVLKHAQWGLCQTGPAASQVLLINLLAVRVRIQFPSDVYDHKLRAVRQRGDVASKYRDVALPATVFHDAICGCQDLAAPRSTRVDLINMVPITRVHAFAHGGLASVPKCQEQSLSTSPGWERSSATAFEVKKTS